MIGNITDCVDEENISKTLVTISKVWITILLFATGTNTTLRFTPYVCRQEKTLMTYLLPGNNKFCEIISITIQLHISTVLLAYIHWISLILIRLLIIKLKCQLNILKVKRSFKKPKVLGSSPESNNANANCWKVSI